MSAGGQGYTTELCKSITRVVEVGHVTVFEGLWLRSIYRRPLSMEALKQNVRAAGRAEAGRKCLEQTRKYRGKSGGASPARAAA